MLLLRDRQEIRTKSLRFELKKNRNQVLLGICAFICSFLILASVFTVAVHNDTSPTPRRIYVSDFYDPTQDADGDGIMDHDEINGYYLFDKVEFEDCIQEMNVDHHQFEMGLSRDQANPSWLLASLDFHEQFQQPADYHLEATGVGSITLTSNGVHTEEELAAIEKEEEVLLKSIDLHFYKNGAKLVPVNTIRQWQYDVHEEIIIEEPGAKVERTWYVRAEYQNVAPDSVELRLSDHPWNGQFPIQYPQISVPTISISSSCALIDRRCLSVNNPDTDNDGLWDGEEHALGWSPFKPDVDRDGLDDFQERHITMSSGKERDTDLDGLRDRIEMGWTNNQFLSGLTVFDTNPSHGSVFEARGRNMNPNAVFNPPRMIDNFCAIQQPQKDPNKMDSDCDGLPDGCIDGWRYDWLTDKGSRGKAKNDLHDFWEGEDLDLDGVCFNVGGWNQGAGPDESRADKADTDNDLLTDGWEVFFSIDPTDQANPNTNDDVDEGDNDFVYNHPDDFPGANNWVGDGVENIDEFVAGTSPRCADSDLDDVLDVNEMLPVVFRTNVPKGGRSAENYGKIASGEINSPVGPANYA